jgi:hypothetical protein
MSMLGNYRAISVKLAGRILDEPSLVEHVLATDRDPAIQEEMAELPEHLRKHMLEMVKTTPSLAHAQAQIEASIARLERRVSSGIDGLKAAGFSLEDLLEPLEIEKAWHGLHYVLAGTRWEPTAPPGNAVLGGTAVGEDVGYGPARLMNAPEVDATAKALAALTTSEIRARFDGPAKAREQIYPRGWSARSDAKWLVDAFVSVRDYFDEAAKAGFAMLLWID